MLLNLKIKPLTLTGLIALSLITPSVVLAQTSDSNRQNSFTETLMAQTNFDTQPSGARMRDLLPDNWNFSPPRGTGTPRTESGGTRGDECLAKDKSIMLLVPPTNGSYTTTAYPSFYWYLPENNGVGIQFTLLDENYQKVYTIESDLQASNPGQFMSVTLPNSMGLPPLDFNKAYHWQVTLVCDQYYSSGNIYSDSSTIMRVPLSPNLENQLQGANLEQQVILYANAQPYPLWSDTLNALMLLRRLEPNNPRVEQAWEKLLKSAQLDELLSP
jgi:hypothetical protein